MGNPALRLAALHEQKARLQVRIEQLENLQKKQARKEDTRLKVLIGAGMLADAEYHQETRTLIRLIIGRAIKAGRDRDFLKMKGWL